MPLPESPLAIAGRWINGQVGRNFEGLNPATSEAIAVVPHRGKGFFYPPSLAEYAEYMEVTSISLNVS